MWTLGKQISLTKDKQSKNPYGLSCCNSQQFLLLYRFYPYQSTLKSHLIGLIPLKAEDEQYWISPIDSDSEYNEHANRVKMQRLREQGVRFMENDYCGRKTYDYNLFAGLGTDSWYWSILSRIDYYYHC